MKSILTTLFSLISVAAFGATTTINTNTLTSATSSVPGLSFTRAGATITLSGTSIPYATASGSAAISGSLAGAGDIVAHNMSEFATAAQGALGASALQSATSTVTGLSLTRAGTTITLSGTSVPYATTSGSAAVSGSLAGAGNIVTHNTSEFATAAQGSLAAAALPATGGTVSGNLAVTGTMTVTGTTTSSLLASQQVMTRTLTDSNPIWSLGNVRPAVWGNAVASGSGASASVFNILGGAVVSGTVAGAKAGMSLQTWYAGTTMSGVSMSNTTPIAVAMFGGMLGLESSNSAALWLFWSSNVSSIPAADATVPTTNGWGFKIYWSTTNSRQEIIPFVCVGGTATWGTSQYFFHPYQYISSLVATNDGAGTIKLFRSSTAGLPTGRPILSVTLSGAPSDGSQLTYSSGWVMAASCASGSNSANGASLVITNTMLQIGQAY